MRTEKQIHDNLVGVCLGGTLILISCLLSSCGGADIGNKSSATSDDDTTITTITQGSDDGEECPKSLLFKPVSESDGNLVILFPTGYIYQEVCVEAFDESLECVTEYAITNGGRATYRFSKPGDEYTGLVLTEACEWQVKTEEVED